MYESNQTMLAVLLVVGLIIGAGAGYMLAPKSDEQQTNPQTGYPPPPTYNYQYDTQVTKDDINGLCTLIYGSIGASLIAALAAIVTLMQVSRRLA